MEQFGELQSVRPPASPFLKWAGGKSQLLPEIQKLVPRRIRTYFEPFLGGGALFFALSPERAVVSDLNGELVNAYRVIQREPEALMKELDKHQPKGSDEEYFKKIRALDPAKLTNLKRAARIIFLNKTCFNGLYRVNSQGRFNTPFNHNKKAPALYDRSNILACHRALKGKAILEADYVTAVADAEEGDFVYFDPPYQPLSATARFTSYTADDFSFEDQGRLAEVVRDLVSRGCRVMLSNSAHPDIEALYSEFDVRRLKARRAINSDKNGRGAIDELLVLTYDPRAA